MGQFSQIDKAQVNLGGNWLKPPGRYTVYVSACKTPKNRKNKLFYVVELDILASNNPDCRAGMKASCVFNLTDHDAAWGNLRGFLSAAATCSVEEVDEKFVDESVSADNPMRGQLVDVEVINVKTESGGNFSKHIWYAVSKDVQAEAGKLRAKAGFDKAA